MTRSRKTLALTFVVAAANCIPAHTTFAAVHEELTDAQKRSLPFGDLTDFSTLEVEAIELSNGVYLLTDAEAKQGALVTAFVGDEEILLVDTAYPEGAPAVLAALRDLSARPISIVVATHWHADHIGAAGFWKRQGARIVAQERTRSRRLSPQTIPAFGKTYPPLPPEDLPDTTFRERMVLHLPDQTIELTRSAGHTDGDVLVRFVEANVFALGDLSFGRQYPFMDVESGGSWPALVQTFDDIVALSDRRTRYVPGHLIRGADEDPVLNYDDVVAFRNMLRTVERRVSAQLERGISLETAIEERPLADLDPTWERSPAVTSASVVSAAYRSIQRDGANPY